MKCIVGNGCLSDGVFKINLMTIVSGVDMRRTLEWQIQRTGFLFRTSSVFLHGCVLFYFILFSLVLFDTWNIFESLNMCVFYFIFLVSFDARFGC
jgi:hypothetical protein